jgi:hypothetical protein
LVEEWFPKSVSFNRAGCCDIIFACMAGAGGADQSRRRRRRLYLHPDDTISHNSNRSPQCIAESKFSGMSHPPCSPWNATNDCYPFNTREQRLQICEGRSFEELRDNVHEILSSIERDEFEASMTECVTFFRGAINHSGKYRRWLNLWNVWWFHVSHQLQWLWVLCGRKGVLLDRILTSPEKVFKGLSKAEHTFHEAFERHRWIGKGCIMSVTADIILEDFLLSGSEISHETDQHLREGGWPLCMRVLCRSQNLDRKRSADFWKSDVERKARNWSAYWEVSQAFRSLSAVLILPPADNNRTKHKDRQIYRSGSGQFRLLQRNLCFTVLIARDWQLWWGFSDCFFGGICDSRSVDGSAMAFHEAFLKK